MSVYTNKQLRCEHCGFGFRYTGTSGVASAVCPACGGENVLPPEPELRVASLLDVDKPPEKPLKQTGQEIQHVRSSGQFVPPVGAVQSAHRANRFGTRRRTVLVWTVLLQCCIIIATAFFVAKTFLLPKEFKIGEPVAVKTETPSLAHSEPALPSPNNDPAQISSHQPKVAVQHSAIPHSFAEPLPAANVAEADESMANPAAKSSEWPATERVSSPNPAEQRAKALAQAETLIQNAVEKLRDTPQQCFRSACDAVKIYKTLGEETPESLYWLLARAYVSLNWGKPLLKSVPSVERMTLCKNNRWLVTQHQDKTVWLWDLSQQADTQNTGSPLQGISLDSSGTSYIGFQFTPDGRWIIGGQEDGFIRIWDRSLQKTAEISVMLKERIAGLTDLQVSPDGHYLVAHSAAKDSPNAIKQVAFANKNLNKTEIAKLTQAVQKDDSTLMSDNDADNVENDASSHRSNDNNTDKNQGAQIFLWDLQRLESGLIPAAIPIIQMPQPVRVMRFSPDSNRLALGCEDGVVRIYHVTEKGIATEPFILRGHKLAVTQIAFAPNANWLATGGQDNTVRLWNLQISRVAADTFALNGHIGWISSLAIDPLGNRIYSGSFDKTVRVWSIDNNKIESAKPDPTVSLSIECGIPESLIPTQDGTKIVIGGSDGSLSICGLPCPVAPNNVSLGDAATDDAALLESDTEPEIWDIRKAAVKQQTVEQQMVEQPSLVERSITFRNGILPITHCAVTTDSASLIFGYENVSTPLNSGIRLWSLQTSELAE